MRYLHDLSGRIECKYTLVSILIITVTTGRDTKALYIMWTQDTYIDQSSHALISIDLLLPDVIQDKGMAQ